MAETAKLNIIASGWALYGYSAWQPGDNELYAARGNGGYYFSFMKFDTTGLSIGDNAALTLEVTLSGTSNPYGTSLILTTSELSPGKVHELSTETAVKAVEGFVAYTNCASHTSSGNVAAGNKAAYSLTAPIKGDTQYYIYIRRRIGVSSSVNGFTSWYDPMYSQEQAGTVTLELVYEPGGGADHVYHNGAWHKGARYIWHNGAWIRGRVNIRPGGEPGAVQACAEIQGDVLYLTESGGITMEAAVSNSTLILTAAAGATPSITANVAENTLVIN